MDLLAFPGIDDEVLKFYLELVYATCVYVFGVERRRNESKTHGEGEDRCDAEDRDGAELLVWRGKCLRLARGEDCCARPHRRLRPFGGMSRGSSQVEGHLLVLIGGRKRIASLG